MSVAGAVLTGGASRRMGRDKATLPVDGIAMARRVADALIAGGCATVLAVGGDTDGLARLGLEAIPDGWPGEGPVGGIVTALAATDAPTVVAACDLPWLDAATVGALVAAFVDAGADPEGAQADAFVAVTDRIEPLCALWQPAALPPLRAAFAAGERAVHRALGGLRVVTVRVDPAALRNVNTPEDAV
jgi:molybdopterin-guanine dinucleotide biosynthesis protein A